MARRFYHPPPEIGFAHVALLLAMLVVATIIDSIDAARMKFTNPPLKDLAVIRRDRYAFDVRRRIEADDPEFEAISQHWGSALRDAFAELPDIVDFVR